MQAISDTCWNIFCQCAFVGSLRESCDARTRNILKTFRLLMMRRISCVTICRFLKQRSATQKLVGFKYCRSTYVRCVFLQYLSLVTRCPRQKEGARGCGTPHPAITLCVNSLFCLLSQIRAQTHVPLLSCYAYFSNTCTIFFDVKLGL